MVREQMKDSWDRKEEFAHRHMQMHKGTFDNKGIMTSCTCGWVNPYVNVKKKNIRIRIYAGAGGAQFTNRKCKFCNKVTAHRINNGNIRCTICGVLSS